MNTDINPIVPFIEALQWPSGILLLLVVIPGYFVNELPFLPRERFHVVSGALTFIFLATLVISVIFFRGKTAERRREQMIETIQPVPAVILDVKRTAISNDGSRARLFLEVRPDGKPPYKAKSDLHVGVGDPRLVFSPGDIVNAYIDPDDPDHVEVMFSRRTVF